MFTIGMVVLWLLLHKLLKPLDQVKKQAEEIHNNKFVQQAVIPRTTELRSVVIAMNRMVEKVHNIFDEQEKTLTEYQKLLYVDEQSGLGNRKYFMGQLERAHSEEARFHGNLAVIKVHNLEFVHDHYGYKLSDKVLKTLSDILRDDAGAHSNEYCARLGDDEFALLVTMADESIKNQIESIFEKFQANEALAEIKDEVFLTAGVTSVHSGNRMGETLADSDFALSQAVAGGAYTVYEKTSSNIRLPQGKMQWRSWLESCISEGKFYLVRQKVITTDDDTVHQEVFIRLKNDEGQIVPAGMFMPMASSLDLGENIDQVVFKLVKDYSAKSDDVPMALNLTESVFSHADALLEFNQLLHFFQQSSLTFCVEASHRILEQYPAMCAGVAESVRKSGNVFGIDNLNFGISLQALQNVRPDYVKINAKTLFDMTQAEIPAAYQALKTITSAMDIRIIAVGVDAQEVYDHLHKLGVTAMQGNLLSEPEEFL